MVELLGIAEQGVADTAAVELHPLGVDADGKGTVGNQVGGDVALVGGHGGPVADGGRNLVVVELAGICHPKSDTRTWIPSTLNQRTIDSLIGVGGLSLDTASLHDVLVGVAGKTAVAALVDLVAVHKLLLGQGGKGVSGKEPDALDVTAVRDASTQHFQTHKTQQRTWWRSSSTSRTGPGSSLRRHSQRLHFEMNPHRYLPGVTAPLVVQSHSVGTSLDGSGWATGRWSMLGACLFRYMSENS